MAGIDYEKIVNDFWSNTLLHYFPSSKSYVILRERKPPHHVGPHADLTICYAKKGGNVKKAAFVSERKHWYETENHAFNHATRKLRDYLRQVRAEQKLAGDKDEDGNILLLGAVTIETHVKFYSLGNDNELQPYPLTQNAAYELWANETEVHKILTEWVDAVL